MSRYYFDVVDGVATIDDEGVEFESLAAAKAEALHLVGAILSEKDDPLFDGKWSMIVRGENGEPVATFVLRDS